MKNIFLLISSAFFLFAPLSVTAQSNAVLTILDKTSTPITQTVDGNSIQLQLTLPSPKQADITFYLDDLPVAECSINADSDTCTSASFLTLGWFWHADGSPRPEATLRAEADGITLAESKLTIHPRPIVLVHGMISDRNRFNSYIGTDGFLSTLGLTGYVVSDEQFPGVMKMGNIINPAEKTLTIAQNAEQVDMYIEGVKKATGAEYVDLLAHSMGGLVTRYYIDTVMTERDVALHIMLGTPNGGSPCGGALSSLGFWMPATLELQPSYINGIFNQTINDTKDVPFFGVAGSIITDPAQSPCSLVPSDSTVSLASVQAIPVDVVGVPKLEHNFLPSDEALFTEFVKPILQSPAGDFPTASAIAQPSGTEESLQFTKTYSGHLPAGETKTITINIDPNVTVASFGLFDATRTLEISVKGASGKTLELDLENKGIVIIDPETLLYLGYGFENPKPGAWVVTLSTTSNTPSTGADYALYAQFTGGALLKANADVLLPDLGEPVNITASLEGAEIQSAQAIITQPDASKQTIDLSAQDGTFTAEFTPSQAGLHGIEVIVTGETVDGISVDRAAFLSVEAQPTQQNPIKTWVIFLGVFVVLLFPLGLLIRFLFKLRKTA